MLRKLDKVAPYLLLSLLGYLGYCANEVSTVKPAAAKDSPVITRNMLHPVLIEPAAHSSPVDRDPFDVEWSRYMSPEDRALAAPARGPASILRPAAGAGPTAGVGTPAGPGTGAMPEASSSATPPLPRVLNGVMIGPDFRAAIVDDWVYKVGSHIPENDPNSFWVVQDIEIDSIELSFGDVRQVLRMSEDHQAATRPARTEEVRAPARPAKAEDPRVPVRPAPKEGKR